MYIKKDFSYYDVCRIDLVKMLPKIDGKILEVGCGAGATLEYLKKMGAKYVVGVDINQEAINIAQRRNIDSVILLDAERENLPFGEKEFDCIILADILEHLYNPWDFLKKICKHLKDDGYILMSIPNIRYYIIMWDLIVHNEWKYEQAGILDNTHLRFFTIKGIKRLLEYADLRIVKLNYVRNYGKKFKILKFILFGLIKDFSIFQYYILAAKNFLQEKRK